MGGDIDVTKVDEHTLRAALIAWRDQRHRDFEEIPRIPPPLAELSAIADAIEQGGHVDPERIISDLNEAGFWSAEEIPTGQTPSPRVVYAHAAVRRLWQLLKEKEKV